LYYIKALTNKNCFKRDLKEHFSVVFGERDMLVRESIEWLGSSIIINQYDNFLRCFRIFSVKLVLQNYKNALHCERIDQANLFCISRG